MKRFSLTGSSRKKPLEKIPSIDVEFENLSCFVGNSLKVRKQILNSLNGKFFSGQLTGILGSSGAGKSTLLNVLAGYILDGVQGNIKLNGRLRQISTFHRLSAYIMQENLIQPYLTVKEEMIIAAHLKLGIFSSELKKQVTVEEILKTLRLDDCHATEVQKLSGGQKKRLSIALELIGNPPIMFLDEPTSGLDSFSTKQCMDVLQALTDEGRTIVCTIHQPSVKIMQQFHQVYFISKGMCVYNGPPTDMLTFLNSAQLECPLYHSHGDFIIEVLEANPTVTQILANATNNGKNYVEESGRKFASNKEDVTLSEQTLSPSSFLMQFYVLLHRMMIQQWRNKAGLMIQLFVHTAIALSYGYLFFGIGNDASRIISNYKLCMCAVIFFIYCYIMPVAIMFPFELQIIKQEYFNRWYGLRAYYSAMLLRSFPTMIIMVMEFVVIIYILTNQPVNFDRFCRFSLTAVLASSMSEGLGLVFGTILNSKNSAAITPIVIAPWLIAMQHGFGCINQLGLLVKILMASSFARHILVAINLSLFQDREPLVCPEDVLICYYKDTNLFLKDFGALNHTFGMEVLIMIAYVVLFRLVAFINLRLILNPERYSFLYKTLLSKLGRQY